MKKKLHLQLFSLQPHSVYDIIKKIYVHGAFYVTASKRHENV